MTDDFIVVPNAELATFRISPTPEQRDRGDRMLNELRQLSVTHFTVEEVGLLLGLNAWWTDALYARIEALHTRLMVDIALQPKGR